MLLALFSVVDDDGVVAAVSVGAAAEVGARWGHGGEERLVCCIAEPLDDDGEQAMGIGISEEWARGRKLAAEKTKSMIK